MTERYGKSRCPSCRAPIFWDITKPQEHFCGACGVLYIVQGPEALKPRQEQQAVHSSFDIATQWADRYSHGFGKPNRRGHPGEVRGKWNERIGVYYDGFSLAYPEPYAINRKLALLHEHADQLYWTAAAARLRGVHYDDFQVGCALLAYKSATEQVAVFFGMNTKVAKEGPVRPTCAEVVASSDAYKYGFDEVMGAVIVGNLRTEDVGVLKTLHPCESCQVFCANYPSYRPWTRIITAYPPTTDEEKTGIYTGVYEVHSLRQMLHVHKRPFNCT